MQYCEHCNVQIKGTHKNCPLCQNALSDTYKNEENLFPVIPEMYKKNLILRMMIFISISIITISIAVDAMFPVKFNWLMFVIAGIGCIWASLAVVIWKRHNIPKSIVLQVAVITILAVLWDWRTGWHGWSIDYMLPLICVLAMIVMYITAKVLHLGVHDFLIYLVLDGIFGFLPLIFIIFGGLHVLYPSIICVSISVLSLSAILLFEGENIKEELDKRMHI